MQNVSKIVHDAGSDIEERVTAVNLRNAAKKRKEFQLKTPGRPMVVRLGSPRPLSPPLSQHDVSRLITDVNLSDRQVFKVLYLYRLKNGRASVQAYMPRLFKERNMFLADLFTAETVQLENHSGVLEDVPLVFCNDIHALKRRLCLIRGLDSNAVRCKVGIDYGKSFLKFTLSVSAIRPSSSSIVFTSRFKCWKQQSRSPVRLSSARNGEHPSGNY